MSAHEINLALRTAAGHERAAHAAEAAGAKQYEMKMKSAGASVYQAFVLALKSAPEYQGRKLDDAAIRRIYQLPRPRPWWDVHLKSVKVDGKTADREWGMRLIQWHLDPEAAKARRAAQNVRSLANMRKLYAKKTGRGDISPRAAEPTTAEARALHRVSQETALAGRELPQIESQPVGVTVDDLLGEMLRIRSAVQKVQAEDIEAVLEILRTTAREVEEYVQ